MTNPTDTIFLLGKSGELTKVSRRHYDEEAFLQELLAGHTELLISPEDPTPLLLVCREAGIPDREDSGDRWSLDLLLLDQAGVPTLVEVKRSSDSRIRREVVGQMLDYAANAAAYWPADRIRALTSETHGGVEETDAAVAELLGLDPAEAADAVEAFWDDVETNLRTGRLRLLFVADELPRELRRIIEFLNTYMAPIEVLGVEVRQYAGEEMTALVPKLVGHTEAARDAKRSTRSSQRRTTEAEFLDVCGQPERGFFEQVLAEARRRDLTVYWGIKGFSVRVPLAGGGVESLLYGYPAGANERGRPYFQSYIKAVDESDRGRVRARFVEIPGVEARGEYTFDIEVTDDTLEAAERMLAVGLEVAEELRRGEGEL